MPVESFRRVVKAPQEGHVEDFLSHGGNAARFLARGPKLSSCSLEADVSVLQEGRQCGGMKAGKEWTMPCALGSRSTRPRHEFV